MFSLRRTASGNARRATRLTMKKALLHTPSMTSHHTAKPRIVVGCRTCRSIKKATPIEQPMGTTVTATVITAASTHRLSQRWSAVFLEPISCLPWFKPVVTGTAWLDRS